MSAIKVTATMSGMYNIGVGDGGFGGSIGSTYKDRTKLNYYTTCTGEAEFYLKGSVNEAENKAGSRDWAFRAKGDDSTKKIGKGGQVLWTGSLKEGEKKTILIKVMEADSFLNGDDDYINRLRVILENKSGTLVKTLKASKRAYFHNLDKWKKISKSGNTARLVLFKDPEDAREAVMVEIQVTADSSLTTWTESEVSGAEPA